MFFIVRLDQHLSRHVNPAFLLLRKPEYKTCLVFTLLCSHWVRLASVIFSAREFENERMRNWFSIFLFPYFQLSVCMFLYELLCIRFLVYLSVCLCLSTCLHVCCNCLYSYLSIYLYLSVCLPDVCIHLSAYLASYRNNSLPVYLAVSSIIYPI